MQLQNQPKEQLEKKLRKTLTTVKILTWVTVVLAAYCIFWWFTDRDDFDWNFGFIILSIVLIIQALGKRAKGIMQELDNQ
ncbi:hypothetical protein [Gilvibacter sp.]|uniref:hypothetical protein n=1 Tax=Gilvibacter sp. TaxID=2729997 RepID=UPI0025C1B22C|nr:hypothetical protein [Gilvibacter sp.]NQX77626.1 hypothetical protein [Gilvibacter sp.]